MTRRLAAIAIFVPIAFQAVAPIRSYDFFWHLATGRWIVEHHALPVFDPFTLAAARVPWINGEWLYQVALYGAASLAGLHGISWINALFVAALFTVAFWFSSRERDVGLAAFSTGVAFAGGVLVLGMRPAAAAAFLLVVALGVLELPVDTRTRTIVYAIVTIVWINTHPSALLAPLIAAATLISGWRRWPVAVASVTALLVNPFGWRAVVAPLRLTQLVSSGEFVNAEWVASSPALFPILFVTIAAVVVLNLAVRPQREDLWRIIVFIGLAILAVQHVRNQGLYFAALPLLLPRSGGRTSSSAGGRGRPPSIVQVRRNVSIVLALCAVAAIAFARVDRKIGVDDERFPVRAVARLQALGLKGNIYNVDQFGGYLEWAFYPERRVLNDGRNELFREFIALDAQARHDSRAWHTLLKRYDLNIAVDEYQHERVEVLDIATGERRYLPPSLVRYRREEWALIAFDDATMIFARRAAFPAELIERIEYLYLVPDDPFIGYLTPEFRAKARKDIERARREIGDIEVVRKLAEGARD